MYDLIELPRNEISGRSPLVGICDEVAKNVEKDVKFGSMRLEKRSIYKQAVIAVTCR